MKFNKRIQVYFIILLQCNLFLNALKLKKCVIKFLILVLLYFFLFLIHTKLKKMCDKTFSKDPFMLRYCLDTCKTQEMCVKAADDYLPTL